MDRSSLQRIERMNYVLGGIAAAAGALLLGKEQALGILVGVVIGSVNFSLIRRIVERWIEGAASGGSGSSGIFMLPKMGALLAAIFLALKFLPISPIFLALGFSIFFVSIMVETARQMTSPRATDSDEDAA